MANNIDKKGSSLSSAHLELDVHKYAYTKLCIQKVFFKVYGMKGDRNVCLE